MKMPDWLLPTTVLVLIVGIIVLSFGWLFSMTSVLKSECKPVEIVYKVEVCDDYAADRNAATSIVISDAAQKEDAIFKVYREAESNLREQMSAWLTILGFFGIFLGLVVPLAGYLLQKRSLDEEKSRLQNEILEAKKELTNSKEKLEERMSNIESRLMDAESKTASVGEKVEELVKGGKKRQKKNLPGAPSAMVYAEETK